MISDSLGNKSSGEFGSWGNYLKFHFEGKELFIALAPFDKGTDNRVLYGPDNFQLINTPYLQKQYHATLHAEDELTLETVNHRKKKVAYHFVNESRYYKDLEQVSNLRDYEKLILEVSYLKSAQGYYLSSYYLIGNSILNLLPSPQFIDKQYFSLGSYLEANFRISLIHFMELKGKETIIEFDVSEQGIENVSIGQRLGDEIDFQLYGLIKGMSKKWQPLRVNGKTIDTRLRLKISFSYVEK